MKHLTWILLLLLVAVTVPAHGAVAGTATPTGICNNMVRAQVVALDQPYFWNRLGAFQPHGMIFALKRDVVASTSGTLPSKGNAMLRSDKRPRPLVLRVNVGDCLQVTLTNWLNPSPVDEEQVATRDVSLRAIGLELAGTIADDGSHVGNNNSSLVAPGGSATYTWYAEREGTYLLYNGGALVGGEGDNGTISAGLFGAVNVEPKGSVWYRSQVTEQELDWATKKTVYGNVMQTAGGHPIVDYNAKYPTGHPFAGKPILNMVSGGEIFHSDLTAIIAGPNGPIPQTYPTVAVLPDRNKPFREFTIIFHDEIAAVQAFPQFNDAELHHTLHSVRDAFAINYGTGGIGAEILANRLGVGPMYDCTDCLYEEFFLTSWAVGDPAMVVDKPANYPCTTSQLKTEWYSGTQAPPCTPKQGRKATKAFYPDDPSNVYHSYLNDHVKFRNLLAGSDDHHIFHLHAHQWLRSPDGDNSTYLDSQAIGQGTGFTYEITHNGSGNRNKTPGDSIFHCHFYPHFAQGMWAMWRVHDVFEEGTELDAHGQPIHALDTNGNVVVKTRALPDAEIWEGTPIPGLVPLPGEVMPPMPQAAVKLVNGQAHVDTSTGGNPGYPFWIPGVAGHRPPHPPLDFYQDPNTGEVHDGGLPRHVIVDGKFVEHHTRLNFDKEVLVADAIQLKEQGETVEQIAMKFHAQTDHPSCLPDGTCDGTLSGSTAKVRFMTNGADPVGGAPYADPCLAHAGTTTPPPLFFRQYRAANIQMDVVFSKEGWHFPQQRFLSLWYDVDSFLNQGKPPEPFFFRGNTYDCIDYLHTNLVPKVYELDDFQVRTPTDILGQHIHLVKFDVTSSDGSANGFNYEDGTLSPEEVVSRIEAIRAFNNCAGDAISGGDTRDGTFDCPVAKAHPFFKKYGKKEWIGAQTTVQRWYVDDVLNKYNRDRTLRTVFTHDHYGPSTHQQTGLYAGLVVEPEGSTWYHNETGNPLGGQGFQVREDGGPTSWQAVIEGQTADQVYREFLFEFGDFQHAYLDGSRVEPDPDHNVAFAQPKLAINPPGRVEQWNQVMGAKPWVYEKPALVGKCPVPDKFSNVLLPPPCPEAISADDPGTKTVNYRQEPLARRIFDPLANGGQGGQALGIPGDMSHVYRSDVTRKVGKLNSQPTTYLPLTQDVQPKDPYTPLLRSYEGDRVQVRVLVGAHEEEHNFSIHGVRWLQEIAERNSGFRNSQMMGISEHYEFEVPHLPRTGIVERGSVDFLWKAGASVDDLWDGIWGLMRVYKSKNATLHPLSTNAPGLSDSTTIVNHCPQGAPVRHYDVSAIAAWTALPGGTLTYNSRNTALRRCVANPSSSSTSVHPGYSCTSSGLHGPLHDPTAMIFAFDSDLVQDPTGAWRYSSNRGPEPLILRAAAGECVEVKLTNRLPKTPFDLPGYSLMPNIVDEFNINQVNPSMDVGLHAQLVSYDVTRDDGVNVGFNPTQTVSPGQSRTYRWYAGQWITNLNGGLSPEAVEFGSINLTSSDPIKHSNKGLIGALVVEPQKAYWQADAGTRAQAKVYPSKLDAEANPDNYFREFVTIFHTDPNLRYSDEKQTPVRPLIVSEDPAETGQNAINYRTEPVWFRLGILPETKTNVTRQIDMAHVFANSWIGGADPETPVYTVDAGRATRFRVTHGGGHSQQNVFGVHGHVWEEQPYVVRSTVLDPDANPYSEYRGSQYGHGPSNHFDVLLKHGAGGAFGVTGDFMWRDYVPWYLSSGIWGLMRVTP